MTSLLQLKVLLADERLDFDLAGYDAAAANDRVALAWLLDNGWDWKGFDARGAGTAAATHGHISLLEWMRGQGYDLHPDMWRGAVEGGHGDVLDWLNQHGCPTSDMGRACSLAASRGEEARIEQLLDYNLPIDSAGCYIGAAEQGHLDTLKWLHENVGGWTSSAYNSVMMMGGDDDDIAEWADSVEP